MPATHHKKHKEKTKTTNICKDNHIEPQNNCQKITYVQNRKIQKKSLQYWPPQLTIPNTPHIKSHKPKTKKTTKPTYAHSTKLLI
jgi:hypothetical protein